MSAASAVTVNVAIHDGGESQVYRVKIAQDVDATLAENLRALRAFWSKIEGELAEKGHI